MRRAAELTLQNGYSHFRLENAQLSRGSQFGGVATYGTGSAFATGYGHGYGPFSMTATGYSSGFSMPIYRPTTDVGVTVAMLNANEPGAKGAFDAADVLRKY